MCPLPKVTAPRRWRGEAGLWGGYQGLGDGTLPPGFGSLGRGPGGMRIPSTAWGHGETASGTQEAGAREAATPRPPGSRLVFVSRPVAGVPVRAAVTERSVQEFPRGRARGVLRVVGETVLRLSAQNRCHWEKRPKTQRVLDGERRGPVSRPTASRCR